MKRTKNSLRNLSVALVGQGLGLIISFIARIVFIRCLAAEYLGLNGLFTNILTMLSLVELGVGPAMTFSLYKPLADNDQEKVKSLMQLYKRVYIIIGFVVLSIGVLFTPVYPLLINEVPDIKHLNIIYLLFVLNTAVSYFYSYKRSLIICDQKRYIATIYRYGFYFLLNVAQIIVLLTLKNYILFLVLQVLATWLENFFVSKKADKLYPYLKDKEVKELEEDEKKEIKKNVKVMVFHKFGGMVVNSTDNIIMSSIIGLVAVGVYSNYYLITNALEVIILQVFNAIIASVGNLNATESKEKIKSIFDKVFFLNFWIFAFCTICLMVLFNDFITLWIGKEYLFDFGTMLVIAICFYLKGIRRSVLTFRDASGCFYYDRYKPLIEALINLVVSIFLAMKLGVKGVFIGTIISTITTSIWVEPYVLYKHVFKVSVKDYFKRLLGYTFIGVLVGIAVYTLTSFIVGTSFLLLLVKGLVCLVLVNGILWLIFKNTPEFKYFLNFKELFKKKTI